jgi:glutathione S-transferase
MKLYYSPGACSQAPHILMHEIDLNHDAAKVNLRSKTLDDGRSYLSINPKGVVPALELDNGEVLTENAIILQYLGDRAGSDQFLPPVGDIRRYRVLEWINFITTELHKGFTPLFKPSATDEIKQFSRDHLAERLNYVEGKLGSGPFLMGEKLGIPDVYLFVITGWAEKLFGLDKWPNLKAFRECLLERPAVRHVLRFEGLLEKESAE